MENSRAILLFQSSWQLGAKKSKFPVKINASHHGEKLILNIHNVYLSKYEGISTFKFNFLMNSRFPGRFCHSACFVAPWKIPFDDLRWNKQL